MAFFDDFGKKISQASQSTLQKTKDMADVAKINMQISDEEKRINDACFQIGRMYMELHESDGEDAFQELVQSVLAARDKIKTYQAQIQEIKGVLRCPGCGAEGGKDAQFCPACGNRMPETEKEENVPQETEEEKKCSNCGAVLGKEVSFCPECGTKAE